MNHEEMLKIEGSLFYVTTPNKSFAFGRNGGKYTSSDNNSWVKIDKSDTSVFETFEYNNALKLYKRNKK